MARILLLAVEVSYGPRKGAALAQVPRAVRRRIEQIISASSEAAISGGGSITDQNLEGKMRRDDFAPVVAHE